VARAIEATAAAIYDFSGRRWRLIKKLVDID
jgi:hypothetical protein